MKKILAIVLALTMALALAACAQPAPPQTNPPKTDPPAPSTTAAPETTAAPVASFAFAGEYDVTIVNPEGVENLCEEFIVEADGTLHGIGDASGLTSFEGKVNEDGTFSGEFVRLGGTMEGTIDAEGNITGTAETRGRNYTITGVKYE